MIETLIGIRLERMTFGTKLDRDEDRVRKKHAEFLVKDHVPLKYIKIIIVLNEAAEKKVKAILEKLKLNINVQINPKQQFYFI